MSTLTPNTVTRAIGSAQVSILTDGATAFTPDLFPGTDEARIGALLNAAGAGAIETNFNATVIRDQGRVILLDAGPRDLFGPACGNLRAGLRELGLPPERVDTLFATHLHPDHVAGMVTPEGEAVFPNATLLVTEADHDFWSDESRFSGALSGIADWAALARSVLDAYADRLDIVSGTAEIAPGLSVMPLPGHTPGHAGWRLDAGDTQLIHMGDIVHAPALQMADPEIAIAFDIDVDTARATRKRLLDELATDGALVTGGHLLRPAFNRIERADGGYRLADP